jgi:hypothetical protein
MKKFEKLGRLLSKNEQLKIKGGCSPTTECDEGGTMGCGTGGDVCGTIGNTEYKCCTSDRNRVCKDGYCYEP